LPDRLIEPGIGETRAILVENGEIVEARVLLYGVAAAGTVLDAQLKQTVRPAIAMADGVEYLLPKGAPGITEGARLQIVVTREAIPGAEPWKRPLARVAHAGEETPPALSGRDLPLPAPDDLLEQAGWSDLIEEARSGVVRFPGGELRISPTPAMTLIDVDGHQPPAELGLTAAKAAARTIRRHGIGGSIGIDFPTVPGKAQRQQIGEAVDAVLPQPFERTAVNGFGFLQVVRPRTHASLFELAQDRAGFEARALVRRAALERTGPMTLVAHPVIVRLLESRTDWLDALGRQVGGEVSLRADPSLPISGAYAEAR